MLDFRTEFADAVRRHSVDFRARGFLTADDRVFPLGTDTKVLSTVFELFARPLIVEVAEANGYRVEEAKQTIYPDFTLLTDRGARKKIAVDVKTTYRRPDIIFTLGSYTSFLRNNTKNILYPYDQYSRHWILGFVYTRRESPSTEIRSLEERKGALPPYTNIEWFVQEKYKISGESPGSGNTTNIGSIRSRDIEDFRQGRGPFATHGESVFRDYWASYGKTAGVRTYRSLREFLARRSGGSTRR